MSVNVTVSVEMSNPQIWDRHIVMPGGRTYSVVLARFRCHSLLYPVYPFVHSTDPIQAQSEDKKVFFLKIGRIWRSLPITHTYIRCSVPLFPRGGQNFKCCFVLFFFKIGIY